MNVITNRSETRQVTALIVQITDKEIVEGGREAALYSRIISEVKRTDSQWQ